MLHIISTPPNISLLSIRLFAERTFILERLYEDTYPLLFSEKKYEILHAFYSDFSRHMYITQDELNDCKNSFNAHYSCTTPPPATDPNWCPDIAIDWTILKNAVLNDDHGGQLSSNEQDRLVLKIIHRFDAGKYYISVERFLMTWGVNDPSHGAEYVLTNPGLTVFSIKQGGVLVSPAATLDENGGYHCDNVYFASVTDIDTGRPLILGTHAQSIGFTWKEFTELLRLNNNGGLKPDTNFLVVFRSISYDMGNPPYGDESNVKWPHSLMVFLRDQQNDCLDNNNAVLVNKADDLGGICPPRCPRMAWPF